VSSTLWLPPLVIISIDSKRLGLASSITYPIYWSLVKHPTRHSDFSSERDVPVHLWTTLPAAKCTILLKRMKCYSTKLVLLGATTLFLPHYQSAVLSTVLAALDTGEWASLLGVAPGQSLNFFSEAQPQISFFWAGGGEGRLWGS
jgi:hypothetical protein